jgi:Fe-S-cluster containining protein
VDAAGLVHEEGAGCAACCRSHLTIPVYPLELVGIYWYATERLEEPVRGRLKAQLRAHVSGAPCPFLVDEACSIHPLRPMACRQFNVFDRVCAEGEDAFHTRPQDVLVPDRRRIDAAFFEVLPFYGVKGKRERRDVLKKGLQHALAKVLQEQEWAKLAGRMDAWDSPPNDVNKSS